jgi:transposase-like protein
MQPIRTISEISAHIKILPARQIHLYQKISLKAKQLYSLGMSYQQIANSLNVGETTVRRACNRKI